MRDCDDRSLGGRNMGGRNIRKVRVPRACNRARPTTQPQEEEEAEAEAEAEEAVQKSQSSHRGQGKVGWMRAARGEPRGQWPRRRRRRWVGVWTMVTGFGASCMPKAHMRKSALYRGFM